MSDRAKELYERLGQLFLERGMELGLGRPLTAQEGAEDPVVGPIIDQIIDEMLGVQRGPVS